MNFDITHETHYTFSKPIFLEPHILRFLPNGAYPNQVNEFTLQVSPQPTGISLQSDIEHNRIHFCWFDGLTDQLKIQTHLNISNQEINPFNFIFHPAETATIPFTYSSPQLKLLHPCLQFESVSMDLMNYVNGILQSNSHQTLPFLSALTNQIQNDFQIKEREIGPPFTADETFTKKIASCRDLAWMQIQVLRKLGLAARFVSGYYYVEAEIPEYELHAWLEVFIPGAGWIAMDPSAGLFVSSNYIPTAASADFNNTYPVTGSIRGDAVSNLTTLLSINSY